MAKFKKGDKVSQIVPHISGEISAFSVDQEGGEIQYQVNWTEADGHEQSRFFKEHEIEFVAQAG